MLLLDQLAERHINEAIDSGALDDLPGAGQPLRLDDDRHVPAELRAGFRLLKNSGYLPPELATQREIRDVEALLGRADLGRAERGLAQKRLALLQARMGESRLGRSLRAAAEYEDRILRRLGGDAD